MLDRTAELIASIATVEPGAMGAQFFECFVHHMAEALGADYAVAGERIPGNEGRLRTLATFSNLGFCPIDILRLFPGVEACLTAPLTAADGRDLGVVAVLYRQAPADRAEKQMALEILAGSAAAELERQQLEAALRRNERRYQEFLERSEEGVFRVECDPPVPVNLPAVEVLDRLLQQGRIAEINDKAARMGGYESAQGLLGMRLADWPGLPVRIEQIREQVREGFPPRSFQFQLTGADGELHWYERNEVPILENGHLLRVWGTNRDLTAQQVAHQALQESGDRYRTLLEAAADAIFVLREEVVDCNSHALQMFGGTREQVLGQTSWSLSPEFQPDGQSSREKCAEKVALLAQSGGPVTFEWRHKKFDGECFDAEVTLSPVTIGGVLHRMALVEDITGRKKAEKQLQDMRVNLEWLVAERTWQLESANQEMEAFSYSVSHHLRAAIRGISLCSRTVLEDYSDRLDAEGRQWLEHIDADSQELEKLTLALLELSQVSRADFQSSAVDLSAMARATAQRLTQSERARRVEFRIADGVSVSGDPVLLRVVMENLLGNAWKFSKTRAVAEIEFGVRDGAYFVRDNGVGFDMKYADKLFGAFQRLHRSEEFEGTGIGLATVRRVIHRHGGRVWGEGAPDQGATMMFTVRGAS